MGNFGIKISKEGENVNSSSLANTYLDSRYSTLFLLSKQTVTWTADEGDSSPSGTETYTHNLGYCPFTLGFMSFTTQSEEFPQAAGYILSYGGSVATRGGSDLYTEVNMDIKTNTIELAWSVSETIAGSPTNLTDDVDFTVVLHIYGFKLGS